MLSDYIAMKSGRDNTDERSVEPEAPKAVQSVQIQKHRFDRKDPWNWKFPQRADTMSLSTLDEEKDQIKIKSHRRLKTSRNHSLNLLSHDITRKFNRIPDPTQNESKAAF